MTAIFKLLAFIKYRFEAEHHINISGDIVLKQRWRYNSERRAGSITNPVTMLTELAFDGNILLIH